jgi:hypothetical protein
MRTPSERCALLPEYANAMLVDRTGEVNTEAVGMQSVTGCLGGVRIRPQAPDPDFWFGGIQAVV